MLPHQTTHNLDLQALSEAGATGLEPATSSVTGMFYGNDDSRRKTGIALLMRLCRPQGHDLRTIA